MRRRFGRDRRSRNPGAARATAIDAARACERVLASDWLPARTLAPVSEEGVDPAFAALLSGEGEDGEPVVVAGKFAGQASKSDARGNLVELRMLGVDGEPMDSPSACARNTTPPSPRRSSPARTPPRPTPRRLAARCAWTCASTT